MDPDKAKSLFEEGAVIIVEDMPVGNEFGIDYNWWNTGQKFQGLKMIPAGLHFIFSRASVTSQTNKTNNTLNANISNADLGSRCGFFHFFKKREIMWLQWHKRNEILVHKDSSQEDLERIRCNLRDLDQNLGPYPFENHEKWRCLSDHITEEIILKMQPLNIMITSVSQYLPKSYKSSRQNRYEAKSEDNIDIKLDPNCILRFSDIPKRKFPNSSTPSEITIHSMDKSYTLDYVIENCHNNNENQLLGELQLSFICFLVAQVYEGFEQWKRIVDLLCSCQSIVSKRAELYRSFLRIFSDQLREVPEDFFVDIVTRDNFLVTKLNELFSTLQDSSLTNTELMTEANDFRQTLTARFQWDFESEPDEFAPIVVME
ncbi:Protein AAR2-like protein [Trichoplax sp. H2]|uniref:Protein AAR2 homolog n=1 Tax=Trichoplax adhaerens TaxID=10228 RepID=B3RJT3_TRIAD|nr:hypothetical protein TRIADDRAFT_52668 [Trichoplax adhaerens]EDV29117.1 hypothetical protein TRIADDRAFT_52668 [Trichoplax adhaerens]RDD42972.1 Protein AAR2-like protein [Trichoplax sp. H2]|eukprot:XP_002108319.1 hypothetical protein TRIADDRAFT_52668 [Trichoplax adhaerens]